MGIAYKLEVFEGPLDLLLHLIEKNEIDIYNIPISEITDQYMQYLQTMQELELEVTSEFLVMAATLLSIKSRMLLPKPPVVDAEGFAEEEEADPRMELVQKLLEYRKYKDIAEHLREKEIDRSLIYMREADDLAEYAGKVLVNPLEGIHLSDLAMAFQRVLQRSARRHRVARIHRDTISVKERMVQLVDLLAENGGQMLFSRLVDDAADREMIIVTFLALLELVKMRRVTCYQYGLFDEIVIRMREEGPAVDDVVIETDY